jgi:hypothetical protein
MELKESFRSASHRLGFIDKIRTGQFELFNNLKFDPKSDFLDFEFVGTLPELNEDIKVTRIYTRKETQTYVLKLTSKAQKFPPVILKVYQIEEKEEKKQKSIGLLRYEVEIRYLRLLSDLVIFHHCPHITLPIGRAVVNRETASSLIGGGAKVKPGKYHVILSESAETSLTDLISKRQLTSYQLRVILFQIVYTLAAIQKIFPSFRHNDLHLSNVLVQKLDTQQLPRGTNNYCIYYLGKEQEKKFFHDVVRCPFRILLWDMYFSSIGDVETLAPPRSSRSNVANKYYDLHKLFDSLEYVIEGTRTKGLLNGKLKKLVDDVVPAAYKCMSKNLTREEKSELKLHTIHHITPEELLNHDFFTSLLKPRYPFTCIRKYKPKDA